MVPTMLASQGEGHTAPSRHATAGCVALQCVSSGM